MEVPYANVAPVAASTPEGLTPEHLSLVLAALAKDPFWDPADSQGFQKVWASYPARPAQAAR